MVHLLDLRLAFGRYETQLGKSATELKILQLWKNRRRDFKWHIDIWQILTDIDIWQYGNMIDIDILDKDCIYVRLETSKNIFRYMQIPLLFLNPYLSRSKTSYY